MSKKYHKDCESCPTEMSRKVKFKCIMFFLSCLSFLSYLWYFSPEVMAKCLHNEMHMQSLNGRICKEVGSLEVVHKQVGGCLISSSLPCLCCQEHGGYLIKCAHYAVAITLN